MASQTVTCSFKMDRDTYNAYKSVVVAQGRNVKGDLVRYMQRTIADRTINSETAAAIKEANELMRSDDVELCDSFEDLLKDEANG